MLRMCRPVAASPLAEVRIEQHLQAAPSEDAEVLERSNRRRNRPRAARRLGYRLGWQAPDAGKNTTMISPQHDSIFVLSENKNLQRLTASTGTRIWSISAGTPAADILGINYLKSNDRVYITHQGEITSVSGATGSLVSDEGRSPIQSLQWMASTAPVLYEDNFIYGSKGGDLVWQAFNIGYSYKAFNIGKIIDVKPLLIDDILIGIARSGEVAAMNAREVKLRWKHTLLDQITASPITTGLSARGVSVNARQRSLPESRSNARRY